MNTDRAIGAAYASREILGRIPDFRRRFSSANGYEFIGEFKKLCGHNLVFAACAIRGGACTNFNHGVSGKSP
jgi:hypothetical protein